MIWPGDTVIVSCPTPEEVRPGRACRCVICSDSSFLRVYGYDPQEGRPKRRRSHVDAVIARRARASLMAAKREARARFYGK